nr:hypothetical protein [Bacteroidota bacterium]
MIIIQPIGVRKKYMISSIVSSLHFVSLRMTDGYGFQEALFGGFAAKQGLPSPITRNTLSF